MSRQSVLKCLPFRDTPVALPSNKKWTRPLDTPSEQLGNRRNRLLDSKPDPRAPVRGSMGVRAVSECMRGVRREEHIHLQKRSSAMLRGLLEQTNKRRLTRGDSIVGKNHYFWVLFQLGVGHNGSRIELLALILPCARCIPCGNS